MNSTGYSQKNKQAITGKYQRENSFSTVFTTLMMMMIIFNILYE
jgi:hypothetical protein